MTQKYDIFISYRRDAFESANLFATRLKAMGYRVFFDLETMNPGKFNIQLLDVISQCKDFILVLSPNALNRCNDEEDWVRREIICALEHNKNIIPIMLSGFEWPNPMPKGMEELSNYQAIAPVPNTYYDQLVERLKSYLTSKPHVLIRKRWLIGVAIFFGIMLMCFGISRITYVRSVTNLAERATLQIQAMEEYSETYDNVYADWEQHLKDREKPFYNHQELNASIARKITEALRKIDHIHDQYGDFVLDDINDFHVLIMWMHGITPNDLVAFSSYGNECLTDVQLQIALIDTVRLDDICDTWSLTALETGHRTHKIMTDAYYYGYLQLLSHLPSETHESFKKLSPSWRHVPSNVGLNLPDEEYERLQKLTENELYRELSALKMMTEKADYEVLQLEKQLEEMEVKFNRSLDSVQQIINDTQSQWKINEQ